VLIRADTAGCTHGFLAHIRGLREQAIQSFFSVGAPVAEAIRDAIGLATAWIPALEADGGMRGGAEVVEITHLVNPAVLAPVGAGNRCGLRVCVIEACDQRLPTARICDSWA
jgi:hypothetical protein